MHEVASGPEPAVAQLVEVAAHLGLEGRLVQLVEAVCEEAVLAVGAESGLGEALAELESALGRVLVGGVGFHCRSCHD
jgi:hypothetical protein